MDVQFKPILPDVMKIDRVRLNLLSMAHKVEREIKKEFKKTVETWEHDVEFQTKISLIGGPSVKVWTEDQIYGWVNDGTPEHPIAAKNKPELAYRRGFKSKTVPRKISSRVGKTFGRMVRKKAVVHSGIVPREFDEVLKEKYTPKFIIHAEEAIIKGVQEMGAMSK